MKKTIVFLLILIGLFSEAQVLQLDNTYGREMHRLYVRTLLGLPKDTFAVPAVFQDIPFIANKAGTLYTWNITTHVWGAVSAGGGASGIDDVLAIGQALTANRTIDLNGSFIKFLNGGEEWLSINPVGIQSFIRAFNNTGGGNSSTLLAQSGPTEGNFSLEAQFNNITTQAKIEGTATATESTLQLTADSIRLLHNNFTTDTSANYVQTIDKSTGTIGKAFWPSGSLLPLTGTGTATGNVTGDLNGNILDIRSTGQNLLYIDPSSFSTQLTGNNGTANSSILLNADLGSNDVRFTLSSTDGTNAVSIIGNPITNTITSTADSIRMIHDNFITDTAVNYVQTINKGTGTIGKAFWPTSSGLSTLNTLSDASQTFATGTTGTDFNIVSGAGVHTFHIPDAGAAARGFVNTGSQTFAGSKTLTGFTNLTGGHASSTVAGNSNLYVAGGSVGNRTTVAGFPPESAAGLGGKVFINGSTAYTMTAGDAFSALAVASNNVTEAGSGTHPLISALVLRAPVVTNGAGATANMATFYIDAAPSGVTPTGATYAQWIKAGGLRLGGDIIVDKTITAAGTTGNQTINKLSGTVNIAAAGTTVTVTNSFVTASSIVYAVIRTNDSTAVLKNVVAGVGSFVINLTAAANAEISIGFLVIN